MNSRFDNRRQMLLGALALPAASVLPRVASAQVHSPSRIIVGFAPGGDTDLIARLLADKMREGLPGGMQIVVENRPGAVGKIALDAMRAAAADGSAMLLAPLVTPVLSQLTFKNPGYDPAKDMAPVGMVGHFQFALAIPASHPSKNFQEFVAWLKAHPDKANFGSSSTGSLPHFFGIMLGRAIDVPMVHVAYKGGPAMINDLLGGQIPCGIDTENSFLDLHKNGKLRVIASLAENRTARFPELPTLSELGYKDATGSGWYSLWTTAKTPATTVAALNKALNAALADAELKEKFARWGIEPAPSTPDGLERLRVAEVEKWRPVITASGFRAD